MKSYAEVIGDPIGHSRSPFIHNFWLEKLGLADQFEYCAHRVEVAGLAAYVAARGADSGWRGCNITIPHKESAYQLMTGQGLGTLGKGEGDFGAINTLIREAATGRLTGYNTDVEGVTGPLLRHGLPDGGLDIAIIGAGGAARAALWGLKSLHSGHRFRILVRRAEQGQALLDAMGVAGDVLPIAEDSLAEAQLLVNASPLGMTGKAPLDLPLNAMARHGLVFDMVYAPLETELLAKARARGLVAIDGLQMLVGQAARAFELFFGCKVPLALIEDVHRSLRIS